MISVVAALNAHEGERTRGFTFVGAKGPGEDLFVSFHELRLLAQQRAAHYAAAGLSRGDRVALVVPEGEHFIPAFLGALLSMILVYRFSLFHGRLHPYHLLLSGVILNSFIAAVIMFLNSIVDFYQAQGLLFWLMGSLSTRAYLTVGFIWLYILVGFLWLWSKGVSLNLITLGEDAAMYLGVEPGALQRQVFIASSLMIGAMVSVSGMIGFVGLMVPHVMRLLIGSDHRLLLPASFLAGGIFLCWADAFARILLAPAELPVGIVTAFFGGPFFLFLLYREGRRSLGL